MWCRYRTILAGLVFMQLHFKGRTSLLRCAWAGACLLLLVSILTLCCVTFWGPPNLHQPGSSKDILGPRFDFIWSMQAQLSTQPLRCLSCYELRNMVEVFSRVINFCRFSSDPKNFRPKKKEGRFTGRHRPQLCSLDHLHVTLTLYLIKCAGHH